MTFFITSTPCLSHPPGPVTTLRAKEMMTCAAFLIHRNSFLRALIAFLTPFANSSPTCLKNLPMNRKSPIPPGCGLFAMGKRPPGILSAGLRRVQAGCFLWHSAGQTCCPANCRSFPTGFSPGFHLPLFTGFFLFKQDRQQGFKQVSGVKYLVISLHMHQQVAEGTTSNGLSTKLSSITWDDILRAMK